MTATRPNVVLMVLDDLGFADFGCYGSEIATPSVDRLAAEGLRYNTFHVTPLCSPTRACLMTGRNHHKVGMGYLSTDYPSGGPGYIGRIPRSAGTVARVLRDVGYSTFAVGKWHLTPREDVNPAGPFDRWPLGMGFERFYGFLRGLTDQYVPDLVRDNGFIAPPYSPDEGYHLTEDLATQAIRLIQDQQQAVPDKPFFLYFAPGAVHTPHQAPSEWIRPYHNQFDDGWDVLRERRFARQQELGIVPPGTILTARPTWVPAWDELSDAERRVFARQRAVFSGFVAHTDAQIGRLLEFLTQIEALDDTIVFVLSDNGADGAVPNGSFNDAWGTGEDPAALVDRVDEFGAVGTFGAYATGWAWAGNTPLRLWKFWTWLGGVRSPLIVHWPSGVAQADRGQIRSQFAHCVDLMPTILEAAGVDLPDILDGISQQPLDGKSLLGTLADAAAASPRETQYFEMVGSRSIYHRGWKATTDHIPGKDYFLVEEGSRDFDADRWSLFCLDVDFSEANDLAAAEPARLRQMIELWLHEAGRNQVLPLDDLMERALDDVPMYAAHPPRERYVCWPGSAPVETPSPFWRGFTLTAELELADTDAAGIICAHHLYISGWLSPRPAWACYLLDGRPVVALNLYETTHKISAEDALSAATTQLGISYAPAVNGSGSVTISVDGREVRTAAVHEGVDSKPLASLAAKLVIGRGHGLAACDDYSMPFAFTGRIHRCVYEPVDRRVVEQSATQPPAGTHLKGELT